MKKEEELTTIAQIKTEAMKIEIILEESKKKSATVSNGPNGNRNKPVLINQINEGDPDNIDAMCGNGYKGQNYNPNHQGNKNGPIKCTHCKKPGHPVEKCFVKFQNLRPQNGQKPNTTTQNQSKRKKKYCKFCDKEGHTTEKCFVLEKKVKSVLSRIHEVQNGNNGDTETPQKTNSRLLCCTQSESKSSNQRKNQ